MFLAANLSLSTLPDPLCPFGWAALLPAGPVGICLGSLLVTGAFWRGWLFWALCTSGLVPGLENVQGTTVAMGLPCVASVPCSASWELSRLGPFASEWSRDSDPGKSEAETPARSLNLGSFLGVDKRVHF